MEADTGNLKERLVAGFERGGRRRRFDPKAKQKLVQACLQPGVSIAAMAVEYGLHANLLRKWIRDDARGSDSGKEMSRLNGTASSAFIPVVQIDTAHRAPPPSRLVAELPNGVMLKLDCSGHDATMMSAMIETLVRCHVPARC